MSYSLTNAETAWLIVMFAFGLKFLSVLFKIFNVFKLYTEDTAHDDTNGNDKITVLYSAKIVSGKGDYIFSPNDKLTREEDIIALTRYYFSGI